MKKLSVALAITLLVCMTLVAQNQPAFRPVIISDSGANDSYAGCPSVTVPSYQTGMRVFLYPNTINTGAASINICSLGAKTIKKVQGGITTDLDDGDIRAGQLVTLAYDGTNFQLTSPVGNWPEQTFVWVIDGGGSAIAAANGPDSYVIYNCSVREAYISANQSGNLTVDVEKATYTTGTPTWSTVSSAFSLSGAQRLKDTTLTGWTATFSATDMIRIKVPSPATSITSATVILRCK